MDHLEQFLRLKHIDEKLSSGGEWSVSDLHRSVAKGMTERTIQKDLVLLEEYKDILGISFATRRVGRKKLVRYVDPSKSIFRRELSERERMWLSEMLALLVQFDGLPSGEAVDKLADKLNLQPSECRAIQLSESPYPVKKSYFNELFHAIIQQKVVSLSYAAFSKPSESLCLSPYLLKEYNRRWFLFAADETGTLRTVALDRIRGVEQVGAGVGYIPCEIDWTDYFDEIIGVTRTRYGDQEVSATSVLFWVSDRSLPYVQSKPLHSSQVTQKVSESMLRAKYPSFVGGGFFRIECIPNYEMYRELSSFGKELIVLSPRSVQDAVYEEYKKMCEVYEDIRTNVSQ